MRKVSSPTRRLRLGRPGEVSHDTTRIIIVIAVGIIEAVAVTWCMRAQRAPTQRGIAIGPLTVTQQQTIKGETGAGVRSATTHEHVPAGKEPSAAEALAAVRQRLRGAMCGERETYGRGAAAAAVVR